MTSLATITRAAWRACRLAGVRRVLAITLVASFASLLPVASQARPTRAADSPDAVCNYLYEWVHVVRFPIQADPHAAYSFVALSVAASQAHVGFVVHGPFPYAAWTSWDVYNATAKPTAVANDNEIIADRGSVNPFVVGRRLLATRRDYTLLYLPRGVPQWATAKSLSSTPRPTRPASSSSRDPHWQRGPTSLRSRLRTAVRDTSERRPVPS